MSVPYIKGTVVENKLTANNVVLKSDISSVVKQTLSESGMQIAQGYDIDENGNIVIFSKTPSSNWYFNGNSFITTISSDSLIYTNGGTTSTGIFSTMYSLQTVNLNKVKNIGSATFYESSLSTINVPNCDTLGYGVFELVNYYSDNNFTFNGQNVKTIGDNCFKTRSKAHVVINIPNVETIGGGSGGCFGVLYSSTYMDIYINGNITEPPTIKSSGTFIKYSGGQTIKVHVKSSMLSKFQNATNWSAYISAGTIELIGE